MNLYSTLLEHVDTLQKHGERLDALEAPAIDPPVDLGGGSEEILRDLASRQMGY